MVFPKDGRAEIAALVASVERHLVFLINHSGGKRLDECSKRYATSTRICRQSV
jgi:hypothetical protein